MWCLGYKKHWWLCWASLGGGDRGSGEASPGATPHIPRESPAAGGALVLQRGWASLFWGGGFWCGLGGAVAVFGGGSSPSVSPETPQGREDALGWQGRRGAVLVRPCRAGRLPSPLEPPRWCESPVLSLALHVTAPGEHAGQPGPFHSPETQSSFIPSCLPRCAVGSRHPCWHGQRDSAGTAEGTGSTEGFISSLLWGIPWELCVEQGQEGRSHEPPRCVSPRRAGATGTSAEPCLVPVGSRRCTTRPWAAAWTSSRCCWRHRPPWTSRTATVRGDPLLHPASPAASSALRAIPGA